jgi:heme/copper-type cytochrome/quinol oxidase subunit 2
MMHVFFLILAMAAVTPAPVHPADGKPDQQSLEVLPDTDGVQRATIILDSYSYSPNHLIVQKDKPVELTLHSVTFMTPHNFVLKEPAAGLSIEEDVPAGKDKIVRFTPTQPGTYPFICDKKLLFFKSHREKGMEGQLEVR